MTDMDNMENTRAANLENSTRPENERSIRAQQPGKRKRPRTHIIDELIRTQQMVDGKLDDSGKLIVANLPPPKRQPLMALLRARDPIEDKNEGQDLMVGHEEITRCTIFIPDEDNLRDGSACIANINGLTGEKDHKQVAAYALGILCCIVPSLRDDFLRSIPNCGFELDVISLPSEADVNAIDLMELPNYDTPTTWSIFSMTILYTFKQVLSFNFVKYSNARFQAIKAILGLTTISGNYINPYDQSRAEAVRTILGSSPFLKKTLINFLIRHQHGDGTQNSLCRYLSNLLYWSEMNAFQFVMESLVNTQSIVLTDPRVITEVLNYTDACAAVAKSNYPQFFRYLGPPALVKRIERNQFPILYAVARKIKDVENAQPSVKNINVPKEDMNYLVEELFRTHVRTIKTRALTTAKFQLEELLQPIDRIQDAPDYRVEEPLDNIDSD